MRVLFVSSPGLGHLFPLVPLAWAFRAEGHEVVVAIAEHAPRASGAGLDVVDVAPAFDSVAVFERVARDQPDFASTVATRPAVDLSDWGVQIAAVNRPLVPGLMTLVDDWGPDLVVYEQGATAGLFAAARAGVPAVQRNHGGFSTGDMHRAIASFMTDLLERYDLDLTVPAVTLESFPASMLDREPEGWLMRWVSYAGGEARQVPDARQSELPRVVVSMGTIELQAFGGDSIHSILEAAAGVEAEFLLALGELDLDEFTLPPNVATTGWVPLHRVLKEADAVVHHGSGGMIMTSVDTATPQLLAPDPRDMFQHSGREAVRRLGIGILGSADTITSDQISRLLRDGEMAENLRRVRDEMHALPTPAATVSRLLAEL